MTVPPASIPAQAAPSKGKLLVIDDDQILAGRTALSMARRGFETETAFSVAEATAKARAYKPDFALVDLRLGDGSGLDVVQTLKDHVPNCRIVVVTAFGNIATAVAAVKSGAVDYLSKPADAAAIEAALLNEGGDTLPPLPENPMPADRVKWEHIQRIYEQCNHNVSETARKLGMHRRTLQRILAKYAPREQED